MKPRSPRTVYKGRVFHVEHEVVALPNGHTVEMDVVRHRGSVVLVPQPSPGRVILIRQYRHVIRRWIWELPAGTLEPGEAPARAAKRECEEETGWRPGRVVRLGQYYATPGFCDERMIFYGCFDLNRPDNPAAGDDDEQLEPRVFTARQVQTLIETGRIVDMKTVVGMDLLQRGAPGRRRRAG